MLLRLLMGPIRRHWRRVLHRSAASGRLTVGGVQSLGRGVLADLDYERRQTRTVESQQAITELRASAESASRQLLIDLMAITHVQLGRGEGPSDRMTLGVSRYLRWHEAMDDLTREARAVRRDARGTPLRARDRTDLKKDIIAIATVAGEVTLWTGSSPGAALLGLAWLTAAVLLLAEIAFGKTSYLVGLCWIAAGGLGVWQRSAIGEWALSVRPWLVPAGLVAVGAMGLLAARRPHRTPAAAHERDPHRW